MLDDDLKMFVGATIPTVWSLELLMLLRMHREAAWTEEGLVKELRASSTSVVQALKVFITAGLVVRHGETFVYEPANEQLDKLCDALEEAYRERPVAVMRVILSTPDERLRTFADAFRLRPTEPKDPQ